MLLTKVGQHEENIVGVTSLLGLSMGISCGIGGKILSLLLRAWLSIRYSVGQALIPEPASMPQGLLTWLLVLMPTLRVKQLTVRYPQMRAMPHGEQS